MTDDNAEYEDPARMTVRRMPFSFTSSTDAHWNKSKPEFSQLVNAASFGMPYLEPYLIKTMREARSKITDERLKESLDLYVFQEAQHYQQHKKYNDQLAARYDCVASIEKVLADDYKRLGKEKSLRFNIAYAEGFEAMALVIGHMLINDREFLFGGSDTSVASLVLWHFVEEIEHKNVTFEVFEHLDGTYRWRIFGLFYAATHIMSRTGQGYRQLLKEDGLWSSFASRLKLMKLLVRIFSKLLPGVLRICMPGYRPASVKDPEWASDWAEIFEHDPDQVAQLDTNRFDSNIPIPLAILQYR
ncbi:MAG: metal-dependent hydrolase [Pseudomonadales bacterium]